MKISGNTILITGGATGIGFSLAGELIKLGNTIIICGRTENKLAEAARLLPGLQFAACDLTVAAEREKLAEWVLGKFPETNYSIC